MLRSPLQTSWERSLAPFVDAATASPQWQLLTLSLTPLAPLAAPAAQPLARNARPELEAPVERSQPKMSGLFFPEENEVEAILAAELEIPTESYPGRKRSNLPGAYRTRVLLTAGAFKRRGSSERQNDR